MEKEMANAEKVLKAGGFEVWETGGGCTAWRRELADGGYCLVTSAGGEGHEIAEGDLVIVGFYDADGNDVATFLDCKVQS
jgi:hypothetical protein